MGTTVVSISITRKTASVSRAGFGTPLLLGAGAGSVWAEYSDASDMLDDGYTSTDDLYILATTVKSQNPSVEKFMVGQGPEVAMEGDLAITLANAGDADVGKKVSAEVDGEDIEYTIQAGDDASAIATGWNDALTAAAADVNCSGVAGSGTVALTADAADKRFVIRSQVNCAFTESTDTTGIADALTAVKDLNNDWYAVFSTYNSKDDLTAIATWVEAESKIASLTTHDPGCWDAGVSDDALSDIQALGFVQTTLWVQPEGGYNDGAAIGSRMLTTTPGSASWAHKALSGVPVSNFNEGELTVIESKNGNYYRNLGGSGATWQGMTPGGEFIDVMRLVHWTEARCVENVTQVLKANEKIPYTDNGVAMIKTPILAVLNQGVDNGGYKDNPAPSVSAPKVADVSTNDKANRILPDVSFVAYLAGAIHSVVIKGVVSL